MRIKGKLYFGVAPIALAGALSGVPAQLSAQQAPPGVNISGRHRRRGQRTERA